MGDRLQADARSESLLRAEHSAERPFAGWRLVPVPLTEWPVRRVPDAGTDLCLIVGVQETWRSPGGVLRQAGHLCSHGDNCRPPRRSGPEQEATPGLPPACCFAHGCSRNCETKWRSFHRHWVRLEQLPSWGQAGLPLPHLWEGRLADIWGQADGFECQGGRARFPEPGFPALGGADGVRAKASTPDGDAHSRAVCLQGPPPNLELLLVFLWPVSPAVIRDPVLSAGREGGQ